MEKNIKNILNKSGRSFMVFHNEMQKMLRGHSKNLAFKFIVIIYIIFIFLSLLIITPLILITIFILLLLDIIVPSKFIKNILIIFIGHTK